MKILYTFSEVYEDDDGWFRFSVLTPSGEEVESGEYFNRENAVEDCKFVFSSHEETMKFLKDFSDSFEDRCSICGREFDDTMTFHHLIPRCKKGKEGVTLHLVCHNFLHATFTDKELAQEYNTVEKLMQDERVQKFSKWVAKRPRNFTDPSTMSNRKNPNKRK